VKAAAPSASAATGPVATGSFALALADAFASPRLRVLLGIALLAALLLPMARQLLETSMRLQMLAQYPALMLAGAWLAAALPSAWARRLLAWNALGISGLCFISLSLMVLMIPRTLDLALTQPMVEAAKFAALLLAGAVLWPSWRAAGWVVQGFFIGNLLLTGVTVGTQYQDAPQRLCNAYLLDDQQGLGTALVWGSAGLAAAWLLLAMWRLSAATTVRPQGDSP
jgi:hypothetical protein